jgi:hypothetical protein
MRGYTIYPLSYDKNAIPGTARFVKAYNKWTAYIREENILNASQSGMESTLGEAKKLIKVKDGRN